MGTLLIPLHKFKEKGFLESIMNNCMNELDNLCEMDLFLEAQQIQKLTQEKIESLSRCMIRKEIK